ncbi:MAG TPA: hypothetical protein VFD58_18500 [Blastocatellia bacterium]|nr:hypothetical protein [Blastocatellia bacterium]
MKFRLTTFAIVLSLAIVSLAGTQTKPNLSGLWKMNPQKSNFGPNGGPDGITIKFDQKDSELSETLTISAGGNERAIDVKYTTDGKEGEAQIGGDGAKTTAKWDGDALVIEWKNGERVFRRKFTLSGDGKTMTIAVHHVDPNGERDETVVLEKQ